MRQILWFRRDLRIEDNAILANARDEVLPIFIFDTNILSKLDQDDKRVNFIFKSVNELKNNLRNIGLDLAIFYGDPEEIFDQFSGLQIDEILASADFDNYSTNRDKSIAKKYNLKHFFDSWLLHPQDAVKQDGTPYKVYTPFYKAFGHFFDSQIEEFRPASNLKLIDSPYFSKSFSLNDLGFTEAKLPKFLDDSAYKNLDIFKSKINNYEIDRDFFALNATSNMSVFLRFGLISPKQILNTLFKWKKENLEIEKYKKELFWREFYNCILYHFPNSEFENFNNIIIHWNNDLEIFQAWCDGKTGVDIIDAAMQNLNETGTMPNRLRMIVASFLTKNLLIDWRLGEKYFAKKLIDYEASSNIGSWQWGASTGADSAPYFRVFNPETQNHKFDPTSEFIQKYLKYKTNKPIVDIKNSAKIAIEVFSKSKNR